VKFLFPINLCASYESPPRLARGLPQKHCGNMCKPVQEIVERPAAKTRNNVLDYVCIPPPGEVFPAKFGWAREFPGANSPGRTERFLRVLSLGMSAEIAINKAANRFLIAKELSCKLAINPAIPGHFSAGQQNSGKVFFQAARCRMNWPKSGQNAAWTQTRLFSGSATGQPASWHAASLLPGSKLSIHRFPLLSALFGGGNRHRHHASIGGIGARR
jgi:hypothetical protein